MSGEILKNNDKIWEVDIDYQKYISEHHPEAIEFIKKNRKIFNNKWIDIQDYESFSKKASDGSWLPGTKRIILFKQIVFDVFERRIKPEYIKDDINYNRYITWKTATEDIENQRSEGIKGERWILKCSLDTEYISRKKQKVLVPEKQECIINPEYTAYLKTNAYKEYKKNRTEYETRLRSSKEYRHQLHDFTLPDGTRKSFAFAHPKEKLEMLIKLGVPEKEIQASREALFVPEEPIQPPAPPMRISTTIPAHYEERQIPAKWIWKHSIKFVGKK